jgi:hypothetical protein
MQMKLTDEQYRLASSVLDDMHGDDKTFDNSTEKWEEFKDMVLQDGTASDIQSLVELCQQYKDDMATKGKTGVDFAFIMLYDMWIHKSSIWPVPHDKVIESK